MKVGIYISGLGQSFADNSVEKYATRLMNEMSFSTQGILYEIKTEKINYTTDRNSTVVSICEKNGEVVYKIYDFKYIGILTEKFNGNSLFLRNFWLLMLVVRKFPLILKQFVIPSIHNRRLQTLYLFTIFLVISLAVLLMLPATFGVLNDVFKDSEFQKSFITLIKEIGIKETYLISKDHLETFSKTIVSFTTILLLVVPNANVLITSIATEFICVNDYIQHGFQKQLLLGNLELLVDYITENEAESEIHFHTYSFGSILALDYIYPYGNKVTKNAEMFCKAIITIGTPFEFIKSYYPDFYENRKVDYGNKLVWINIYSIADALATNFRYDSEAGEASFGINQNSNKPININYEVSSKRTMGIMDFIMLYSIKVHGMYWDPKTEGQSCLGYIYSEMENQGLIKKS